MATWLKQSTAVEIKLGPFVDNVDGFTSETALTISQADVRLAKNDGDWGQKNEATTLVHEENGWYRCLLDATDTNTLGILMVAVIESGALPVWREFLVVPANEYDSFILGTDALDVEVASMAAGVVTAAAIATGAIDADATAADFLAEINAEVVDALNTDTYAEPAQGAPAATASLVTKIGFLYKAWRNKKTQTSTTFSLLNDDAATVDHKATISDDGTTATVGEIATGP